MTSNVCLIQTSLACFQVFEILAPFSRNFCEQGQLKANIASFLCACFALAFCLDIRRTGWFRALTRVGTTISVHLDECQRPLSAHAHKL